MVLSQHVWDRGESASWLRYTTTGVADLGPKEFIYVVAENDAQVSNLTSGRAARLAGIPVLDQSTHLPYSVPVVSSPHTGSVYIALDIGDRDVPEGNVSPRADDGGHGTVPFTPEALAMVVEFLETGGVNVPLRRGVRAGNRLKRRTQWVRGPEASYPLAVSASLLPRPRVAFIPSAPYARAVGWLDGIGHSRSDMLRGTNIEPSQLEHPDGLLRLDQVEALVLNAVEAVANPTGALTFGRGLVLPSHGIIGYAGLTAPSVDGALRVGEEFLELVTPLFVLESEEDVGGKTLRCVPRYRMDPVVRGVHLKVVASSLSVAIKHGVGQVPDTIEVEIPADQGELFDWLTELGLRVRRGGADLTIRFPRAVLGLPFVLADAQAHATALERCREALEARTPQEKTIRAVRRLLREDGPPFPDLETTSRRVGVSSRTLRRRLSAEGSSFRELLEQARLSLALQLLSQSDRDITAIAYELGYSHPANFSRAFGRRLGISPSEYRGRQAAGRLPSRPPPAD